jgi:hypothetical protein
MADCLQVLVPMKMQKSETTAKTIRKQISPLQAVAPVQTSRLLPA